jgi:hypothetical protein
MICEPRLSVFINVPFDAEYEPLFDALVFATVCCGFFPRSALETGSTGVARLERIMKSLSASKYSIHDLSRCHGSSDYNLVRFNMPLELGMAITRAYFDEQPHEWSAMVRYGHNYGRYVSDLVGFDLKAHSETVETIVPPYMAWLKTRADAAGPLTPKQVLAAFPAFSREKKKLHEAWSGEMPWWELVRAAIRCVPLWTPDTL